MAKRHVVTMTDDLDPTHAADTTVSFGIDGASYEIDLSGDNADAFGSVLAPYIGAAHRTGGRQAGRGRTAKGSTGARRDSAAVRVWASEQGIELSSRGRIPADVQERYDAAH